MTATLPALPGLAQVVEREYASWGRRLVAALLDSAVLGAVAWFVGGERFAAPTLQPMFEAGVGATDPGLEPWSSSAVLVGAWLLMLVLQGLTGQTPGRRVMGIAVVRTADGRGPADGPPGVLRSVARWFAHLLDAILLVGYLRPLWHRERRTFADSLLATAVVRRPTDRGTGSATRRGALAVTAGAYVLVTVGIAAGVSVGSSGGMSRDAEAACVLEPQDPAAPVRVDGILLARETEWHRTHRLWPWAGDERREERTFLALDVSWQGGGTGDPEDTLLVRTTTSGGGTVDHEVPLSDGWAPVRVERAPDGAVDVAVVLDGRALTSCSATLGPVA
ncbi:RDD family protein [Cellulomonas sp. 179-A 9B4 NHS]|uniref:RDD family protein n=1 Tax=Cellulomonas sp. 179-A 9B4 NHS TaxID=3142379 RepID=UPI0039A1FD52